MNNNIVNNDTGLLCYRLRTERQRKRAAKKDFEKRLRALDRERRELWKKQRNLGWAELKPSVMRGWERFFVLREDVAESIHAEFFANILGKINTIWRSNRKDFKRRKKKVKRWKYTEGKQELQTLNEKVYKTLTVIEQSYFEESLVMNQQRIWIKSYLFREPWRFVLKVRPHIVTHKRVRNEEMESRNAEVENYITKRHLEPAIWRLKGTSYNKYCFDWRGDESLKEKRKFRNTPLLKLLEELQEE